MSICFATNNLNKLAEVREAVQSKLTIVSLNEINCFEELPESRDTLEGNSLQKAEYIHSNFRIPCFADDSGLEVEALGNQPGVFSARYAGDHRSDEDNMNLLLENLKGHSNRKARFRTIVTLIGLGPTQIFEGAVEGTILHKKIGDRGFGYDPIFQPDGFFISFAQMSIEEKNAISHRAIAVKKLLDFLNHQSR